MNKSEREALANIVSEMIYGFDSSPQLVSAGEHILATFPSIGEVLQHYRYAVAVNNVVNCIRSAAISLYDPMLLTSESKGLNKLTFDSVESIFDEYLENFDGDEFYAHLYEIEEKLANANRELAISIISELFQTDYWRTAVSSVYEIGTAEFNYLTSTK